MVLTDAGRAIARRLPFLKRPLRWIYALLLLGRDRVRTIDSLSMLEGRVDDLQRLTRDELSAVEQRLLSTLHNQSLSTHQQWNLQHATLLRHAIDALSGRAQRSVPEHPGVIEKHLPDDFLWSLGGHFRGSGEVVRERLRGYLGLVHEVANAFPDKTVLDLGSGRCEWLELLRESGIEAVGVDASESAFEQGQHLGFGVVRRDVLDYLQSLPAASTAVVTAFHVAEHLDRADLLMLLREAWRVLAPGGLLIIETPNPENLYVASRMFYRDPTHQVPLPPELLEFMVMWAGFRDIRLLRLSPFPNELHLHGDDPATRTLDQLLHGPQDYAIVASTG